MKHLKVASAIFLLVSAPFLTVHGQSIIKGQVKNTQGEKLPFVSIGLLNSQLTTIADGEGNFSVGPVKNGNYILQVKSLGYLEKTDTLNIDGDFVYNPVLTASANELDEITVDATRVDNKNGMAYSNISAETLKKQNLGQDAPYMLNNLANVVVNSDAGNGIGYTGIRIRGSDATRINVTINGVPVNDAESQGTFWVNMPDLISSVNSVQVQRGVGTSGNGAGAFGATINFQTNTLQDKPYANVISTAGSYNTFRNTLAAGTGLLNNKFTLDARASRITSQGYIDRASSDLSSYYLAGGYYGKKSVIKFINFSGQEKTYQAWYYVNEDSIKKGNRTYNPSGEHYDAQGNLKYYKNETDNYTQNNSQLHFIHQVNSRVSFNITGHYTKGKGYYEQYKQGEKLGDYGMAPIITPKSDTIETTDLVRRLWLDNDFAGAIFNLNFLANSRLNFTLGGGYNSYFGKHFGRVMWAQYASDFAPDQQYYLNSANKNDRSLYLKTNYKVLSNVNVFLDLQSRGVSYRFLGYNDSLAEQMQNVNYEFFNPKVGVSANLSSAINIYASVAVANKEPNRDDFVQSSPQSRPKPEELIDMEAGLKVARKKMYAAINLYDMQYKNQLVLNGEVNNVGSYNRVNVPLSYRRGMELECNVNINSFIHVGANLSVSRNKISNFTEHIDSSDVLYTTYTQHKVEYKNTDISFSPNQVSSILLTIKPIKNMELTLTQKNVGRQFLDNTTNVNRSINPYSLLDARINYTIHTKVIPEISFLFSVYNIFNKKYETNGYTFSYYTGNTFTTSNFLAPAAPRNFLGGISLKF